MLEVLLGIVLAPFCFSFAALGLVGLVECWRWWRRGRGDGSAAPPHGLSHDDRRAMSDEPHETPSEFDMMGFPKTKIRRADHDANVVRRVPDGRIYSDGETRCLMEENGLWDWYRTTKGAGR